MEKNHAHFAHKLMQTKMHVTTLCTEESTTAFFLQTHHMLITRACTFWLFLINIQGNHTNFQQRHYKNYTRSLHIFANNFLTICMKLISVLIWDIEQVQAYLIIFIDILL